MNRAAAKVALLAGSLLFAAIAGELALRVIGYEYRPMAIATGKASDARVYHLFSDENFVYDPELIWRPKAGFGVFNSSGFRGPEVGAGDQGVRIAAVGDSNTLGWSGPDGANWPADLGRLMAAGGVEGGVINAGVWGYSSHQGVPRTRQVLELGPQIVLISFGSNDAHRVSRSDADFSRRSLGSRRLQRALEGLRMVQLGAAVMGRLGRGDGELRPRVSEEDYEGNLELMIGETRAAGATPVLLTRPFHGTVVDTEGWKHFGPSYNLATARVAERLKVPLIDIYSFFKEMDELFADESHFTDEGHRRAAAIVFEHLRPFLSER